MDEPIRVRRQRMTADEVAKEIAGAEKTAKEMTPLDVIDKSKIVYTRKAFSIMPGFKHVTVDALAPRLISTEMVERNSVVIRNLSADTVWVGDRGLIAGNNGNGFPIRSDEVLVLDETVGELFAMTEANTSILAIIEQ